MVSLTHLHRHIYKVFALAKHDSISLETGHDHQIFIITIEPTGRRYRRIPNNIRQQRKRDKRGKVPMKLDECQSCGHPILAGICINKKCDSTINPKAET